MRVKKGMGSGERGNGTKRVREGIERVREEQRKDKVGG